VAKAFAFTGTVCSEIVAAAGSIGTGPTVDNEVYHPVANAWSTKSNAPVLRYGGCSGGIGTSLYTAGGLVFSPIRNSTRQLYAYDTVADHWTKLKHMPFGDWSAAEANQLAAAPPVRSRR
jgi:hypothetical protein